jgi:hypothetical protein
MQKEKVIFDDKNEALFTFNDDGLVTTIDVISKERILNQSKDLKPSGYTRDEAIVRAKVLLGLNWQM